MTFSHQAGRLVTNGGFAQRVPLPSNPGSQQKASYHSSEQDTVTAIAFGTLTYTVVIPKGAILTDVRILLTTLFTTAAKIQLGSAASGVDILAATQVDASSSRIFPIVFTMPGGSVDGQTIFVTITGAPAVGAGYLVVSYLNPPTTIQGTTLND